MYSGTIRDLESKVAAGDYYSLVKASGLLRSLMLDSNNLMDLANRDLRIKPRFEIVAIEPLPLQPDLAWFNIDPVTSKGTHTRLVDRQEFLKCTPLWAHSQSYSIKDIIRACAHAKGGIHIGEVSGNEKGVLDIDKIANHSGTELSLVCIGGIVDVALRGLSPITRLVEEQLH